jgi:hypothetical protein
LVRHHLMFCPNCRRFIRQMRLMQATLKAMPENRAGMMLATPGRATPQRKIGLGALRGCDL